MMTTREIVEHLKNRTVEAHAKLSEANRVLGRAQTDQQAAQHEFNTWNNAFQIESKKMIQEEATKQALQQTVVNRPPQPKPMLAAETIVEVPIPPGPEKNETKTSAVRDLLKKNAHGLAPADVWAALKDQMDRAYVYSILKRLKDKKEVSVRRGRYYYNPLARPEETKEAVIVQ